jgi:hypothetical protein
MSAAVEVRRFAGDAALFGKAEKATLVRVASEIILQLSIEQEAAGVPWPHPWDHYPFMTNGNYVWRRYQDLDSGQREEIRHTLVHVKRRLGALTVMHRFYSH